MGEPHPCMVVLHRFAASHGLRCITLGSSADGPRPRPPQWRAKTFHGGVTQRHSIGRGPANAFHGRTKPSHGRARRRRPWGGASTPWPWQESSRNRKRASLSAFRRRGVKVLGFDMKARLRPQRMAPRGCHDPFALVGTIGKACGEARLVSVSGTPRGCVVACFVRCWESFLFCPCVGLVRVSTVFTRRRRSSVDRVHVLTGFAFASVIENRSHDTPT